MLNWFLAKETKLLINGAPFNLKQFADSNTVSEQGGMTIEYEAGNDTDSLKVCISIT